LLGNKAEKLQRIHSMCGTTNTRIEKPESYMSFYNIRVKGTKEGVQMARAEIERLVGITSAQNTEARFQYVSHELERNVQTTKMLAAFNIASKDTPLAMSEATLKAVVSSFRFQIPQKIDHFWTLSSLSDKEKFEICSKCVKHLSAVQAIVFTEHKRVVEMEKRSQMTAQAFGVQSVQFVHRDQTKETRLKSLEAFKQGEVRPDGLKNRLLVTSSDYAKLARKVVIPYVNFIVHFCIPKTKELYTFQSLCAGRNGTPGVALLFILNNDASTQRDWSESIQLKELNDTEWAKSVASLKYDSQAQPLTAENAEPPANWREQLAAEAKK
jgi:superfamily II DNA/RNA helicase